MDTNSFVALVFAIATGLVAAYFILRQAIVDALDEHSRRERDERKRGGTR